MNSAPASTNASDEEGKEALKSLQSTLSVRDKRAIIGLVVLGCSIFALQAAIFWQIASLASGLIVQTDDAVFFSTETQEWLTDFVVLAIVWLGLLWLSNYSAETLDLRLKIGFQQKLQQKLVTQQVALVRQKSHYFWQQAWLDHIPAINDYLVRFHPQKLIAGLVPVFTLGIMFYSNWFVGLVTLIALPILPVFMILIGKGTGKLHSKHFQALERLGSQFTDRLKNMSTLHIFNVTEQQQVRLQGTSAELNHRTLDIVRLAFLNTTVLDFFATISVALVAVFVGFSLLGEINIGPAMSFADGLFLLLLCPSLYNELKQLGGMYHMKSKAEAAASELVPLLHRAYLQEQTDALQGPADSTSFVRFNCRDFEIPETGLKANELNLIRGAWIRLQGKSGSGKTTLFEALMGMRAATHRLPGKCALMTQQALVTPDTVRENLCMGKAIAESRLYLILEMVGLSDWLKGLPRQLDEPMGEKPPLSGGQAQRLSLARLLLSDADIYLLDEPTAHLSEDLHNNLAQLIGKLLANKTVIWATHRSLPAHWFIGLWNIQGKKVFSS